MNNSSNQFLSMFGMNINAKPFVSCIDTFFDQLELEFVQQNVWLFE